MFRTFLTTLGVLLWASQSLAADWLNGCQAGRTVTSIQRNGFVCTKPTNASQDPAILDVGACENFDVLIYADHDGNTTGATGSTYLLKHCPAPETILDDAAKKAAACVTFDPGGGSYTSTGETLGAAAQWFWVDVGGTVTSSNEGMVIVRCNGGQ